MDIFRSYTRRCLKENRTRTWVTIIGIVLSMSLFTAVIEGGYSGVKFLQRSETDTNGSWTAYVMDASGEEEKLLSENKKLKKTASLQTVGWADIGSKNPDKPYLLIESAGAGFTDIVKVNLSSGRMPENSGEILLPMHLYTNGGVQYSLGDVLTLDVGKRVDAGGNELLSGPAFTYDNETLAETQPRTYTVVGFYSRFSTDIENYSCPGYTALTVGEASGSRDVFFELKDPAGYQSFRDDAGLTLCAHSDLLSYYGVTKYISINRVIISFATILVVLISFGSISLIYNSFSISVSERTRQFGILKSVGATKKQIKRSVRYEALCLAGIAIPIGLLVGCAGIGITLYCLRDSFGAFVTTGKNTQMKLVLNPWMLLAAVAACLVTTLIAAGKPARKAIAVSPISSIRESDDVKISAKEVRTSRLTEKLFGFEGMMASKNFKRNKKRCRSVILSLFMSVVLFIAASSFCMFLTMLVSDVTRSSSDADISYYTLDRSFEDSEALMRELESVSGAKDAVMYAETWGSVYFPVNALSKSCLTVMENSNKESVPDNIMPGYFNPGCALVFVDDSSFGSLCRENGLDAEDYMKKDAPMGLLFNSAAAFFTSSSRTYEYTVLSDKSLPCECYSVKLTDEIDGYSYEETKIDENGDPVCYYFPWEYITEYWHGNHDTWDPEAVDYSKAITRPASEVTEKTKFTVGAVVGSSYFDVGSAQIIYPISLLYDVLGEDSDAGYCADMMFFTDDPSAAFPKMVELLNQRGEDTSRLVNRASDVESERMLVKVVKVFSLGFIILISLISLANVFNTITTSINLRRREFATLKSIGLGEKGFARMMNYECLIYGLKALLWGLPVSVIASFIIYKASVGVEDKGFMLPWGSVAIAVGSVFIVVFSAMLYATKKIKADNPIDALKNENL